MNAQVFCSYLANIRNVKLIKASNTVYGNGNFNFAWSEKFRVSNNLLLIDETHHARRGHSGK